MKKTKTSFEQMRSALLAEMVARARGQVIKKVIPFRNDDVPRYLRKLNKFERRSRKANTIVGFFHETSIDRGIV
jgi:hypothetical protein